MTNYDSKSALSESSSALVFPETGTGIVGDASSEGLTADAGRTMSIQTLTETAPSKLSAR